MLALRYIFVNFGADTNPGSPHWYAEKNTALQILHFEPSLYASSLRSDVICSIRFSLCRPERMDRKPWRSFSMPICTGCATSPSPRGCCAFSVRANPNFRLSISGGDVSHSGVFWCRSALRSCARPSIGE